MFRHGLDSQKVNVGADGYWLCGSPGSSRLERGSESGSRQRSFEQPSHQPRWPGTVLSSHKYAQMGYVMRTTLIKHAQIGYRMLAALPVNPRGGQNPMTRGCGCPSPILCSGLIASIGSIGFIWYYTHRNWPGACLVHCSFGGGSSNAGTLGNTLAAWQTEARHAPLGDCDSTQQHHPNACTIWLFNIAVENHHF